MSSGAAAAGLAPLLSPGDPFGVDLAVAFERFPEIFLGHHPGYAQVRPALLPLAIAESLARRLWGITATVLQQLREVPRRHFGGDMAAWIGALGYPPEEAGWLESMTDPESLDLATMFARADFVLGADGPRLVEVNVGPTIGGIGVLDRYSDLLESACSAPGVGRLPGGVSLPRPATLWASVLRRLATARGSPRVALVVAGEEVDIPHPHEAAWYLRQAGIAAEVVGVDGVRFHEARAETAAGPLDIVYACFTFDQLRIPTYRRFAERALACRRSGGPLYIAPPSFTLFGNKTMLSYVRDEPGSAYAGLLLTTRRLEPALYNFALENRAAQVLKPSIGYGGEGVVIGAETEPAAWQAAVEQALAGNEPNVLQDYVEPVPVPMPTAHGPVPFHCGIGCLAFGGRSGGFLIRQTPAGSRGTTNCRQGATFAAGCVVPADARLAEPERRASNQLADCDGQ
jgi:hypothetical protein